MTCGRVEWASAEKRFVTGPLEGLDPGRRPDDKRRRMIDPAQLILAIGPADEVDERSLVRSGVFDIFLEDVDVGLGEIGPAKLPAVGSAGDRGIDRPVRSRALVFRTSPASQRMETSSGRIAHPAGGVARVRHVRPSGGCRCPAPGKFILVHVVGAQVAFEGRILEARRDRRVFKRGFPPSRNRATAGELRENSFPSRVVYSKEMESM